MEERQRQKNTPARPRLAAERLRCEDRASAAQPAHRKVRNANNTTKHSEQTTTTHLFRARHTRFHLLAFEQLEVCVLVFNVFARVEAWCAVITTQHRFVWSVFFEQRIINRVEVEAVVLLHLFGQQRFGRWVGECSLGRALRHTQVSASSAQAQQTHERTGVPKFTPY